MRRQKVIDYTVVDHDLGCVFVVDTEGQKYLVRDHNSVPDTVPSITISGLVVTVSGIDVFNEVTVSGIDVFVTVSGVSDEKFEYEEIYVQGYNTSNFPNNTSYHPIIGASYIIPTNKVFHVISLTAAQTKKGLSVVSLHRDGSREQEIPMIEDIHITFPQPYRYYEGQEFSVRFKPKDKKTRIQIYVDGYITEE